MLFETFYPDTWVDSTYQIDFDELYKKGYRGLIFDIDNTLVPHGEPADERAKALFAHLKELGFSCCLLSNNQLERVQMFNRDVQVHYIEDAHKPSRKNYLKAMELMGTDLSDTVFIGDQLFTDVYGAKRTGMANILETDPSERRDSDYTETVSGENCFAFLSEKQEIWSYLKKLVEKSL